MYLDSILRQICAFRSVKHGTVKTGEGGRQRGQTLWAKRHFSELAKKGATETQSGRDLLKSMQVQSLLCTAILARSMFSS